MTIETMPRTVLEEHYWQLMQSTWRDYLAASQRTYTSVIEAAGVARILDEYHTWRGAFYRLRETRWQTYLEASQCRNT